jgi:uncharacterized damage-inducible protein DinB
MTKRYYKELAEFHVWATETVCSWLDKIDDAQWKQIIVSSFSNIESTALHTATAEKLWLERFENKPSNDILFNSFKGSKSELTAICRKLAKDLQKLIENFDEERLTENLTYKNIKGVEFSIPYYWLFAHVVNHATYHRGQLVTMLRQVGFTDVCSIDMSTFFTKKTKQL